MEADGVMESRGKCNAEQLNLCPFAAPMLSAPVVNVEVGLTNFEPDTGLAQLPLLP